jgi:hypothetical protein
MTGVEESSVPQACTLPTVHQPLRLAEFDDLFSKHLRGQERVLPSVLRWSLDPSVEAVARDLAARETQCCSFFRFGFAEGAGELLVDVQVPPAQIPVLDALAARAATGMARR